MSLGSFICIALFAITQLSALADGSVTLAWNLSTDPIVTGYNIYYGGASGTYTNEIPAGNATSVIVSGLVPGATYYFAATTVSDAGVESDFSVEVSYLVPQGVVTGNQTPTLNAIGNLSISENAGPQIINLSGITSGATNEDQTLTVTATSSNTNLVPHPTVNYVSANTNGSLSFAPVTNANGTATITVKVNDGGMSNNIVTRTFLVTVSAVNNPPTLNAIGNLNVNENAGSQTVNLSGITSGAANESQTLAVTAVSDNPGLIPNPTVGYTNANTTGKLTYKPVANANGSANITVTVNDGGTSNNIVTRTFMVMVSAVNQVPTLNAIGDLTTNENPGLITVNLSGITSGAAGENQTLTVTASSSDTNLVPHPTVGYTNANTTGNLTFIPVSDAVGTATITVTVNDGGASNNIVNRTFNVTLNAGSDNSTNAAPTLDPISNVVVTAGAGQQRIILTGIKPGTTGRHSRLQVLARSSDHHVVPRPAIWHMGSETNCLLSFRPGQSTGTATIWVTVDNGAKSNNIITRSFNVTVMPPAAAKTGTTNAAPGGHAVAAILTPMARTAGGFTMKIASTTGDICVVEASTDLVHWIPVQTNTAPWTFVDPDTGKFSQRFYRTRTISVP